MKLSCFIILAFLLAAFFPSCRNAHAYDKYVKELDSLKVVLQQAVDNFRTVDSALTTQAYAKQYTYTRFIETHLKDTVTKSVAEHLQNFQSVEKGLHDYLSLRSNWLNEANLSVAQLQSLSHDLKIGSIKDEDAIEFINNEKKRSEAAIEELKANTETARRHLEIFNQSLPTVEALVKQLNSGLLPDLINPKLNPSILNH
jgi:chromosome segregation ATPase